MYGIHNKNIMFCNASIWAFVHDLLTTISTEKTFRFIYNFRRKYFRFLNKSWWLFLTYHMHSNISGICCKILSTHVDWLLDRDGSSVMVNLNDPFYVRTWSGLHFVSMNQWQIEWDYFFILSKPHFHGQQVNNWISVEGNFKDL